MAHPTLTGLVASDRPIEIASPFTGTTMHVLPQSNRADVESAFERARRAQREWASTSARSRRRILLRAHDVMLRRFDQMQHIVSQETGKAPGQALEEVMGAVAAARYVARSLHRVTGTRRRAGGIPGVMGAKVFYRPKGVVGIITPWNYPLALAAMDGIQALGAGNAVVMKIDNNGAASAMALLECLREAGVPEDLWLMVAGPANVVGEAVTDLADYICFTGSTATGRKVAEKAGRRLVGASMELGGKNAVIVHRDVNIDRVARQVAYSAFSAMGQLCVSMERIYVDQQIADAFQKAMAQHMNQLQLGSSQDSDFGTLNSASQLDRVQKHLKDATRRGAQVLAGGNARPDIAPYAFEPTLLAGVTDSMLCAREETFGALVSVYPFATVEEAIQLANDSEYGLNAAVFSNNRRLAHQIARQLHTGTVNINEGYRASLGSSDAPMGGSRTSGVGRRNGIEGLLRFVEPVTVAWVTGVLQLPVTAAEFKRLGPLMKFALRLQRILGLR